MEVVEMVPMLRRYILTSNPLMKKILIISGGILAFIALATAIWCYTQGMLWGERTPPPISVVTPPTVTTTGSLDTPVSQ